MKKIFALAAIAILTGCTKPKDCTPSKPKDIKLTAKAVEDSDHQWHIYFNADRPVPDSVHIHFTYSVTYGELEPHHPDDSIWIKKSSTSANYNTRFPVDGQWKVFNPIILQVKPTGTKANYIY